MEITFFQVKVVMKIGLMYLTYYGNEPQVGKLGADFCSKKNGNPEIDRFSVRQIPRNMSEMRMEMT